jgi:hypothetical protein
MEGCFPESFRAFALNGAEILYRPSTPEPWVEMFEIQNRAAALDNTCYMVGPNFGRLFPTDDQKISGSGGRSMIVDYRGAIISKAADTNDATVAAPININALREHRAKARFCNFIPFLRTEIYKKLYEKQIWPKNLPPLNHADADKLFYECVKKLQSMGIYTPPEKDRSVDRSQVVHNVK